MEITEREKKTISDKLKELEELEKRDQLLKQKKKQIEKELNRYRPELDGTLEEVGKKRVNFHSTLVSRTPKAQHRKPSLTMTYQAIQMVLGEKAVEMVKKEVRERREYLKKKHMDQNNIKVIPIRHLRKKRKDYKGSRVKKSRSDQSETPKKKKLKFTRRK